MAEKDLETQAECDKSARGEAQIRALHACAEVFKPPFYKDFILNDRGKPAAVLANAIHALSVDHDWTGVLRYDEFRREIIAYRAPPWHDGSQEWKPREWTDSDDIRAAEWLQHNGINVSVETARQAVHAAAEAQPVHPIKDYLNGRVWDGNPRAEYWLSRYLGAKPSDYVSAVGKCFLISMVARIMEPGCKVDTVMILEGKQGIGKSSALAILGGEWFTDEIAELGSKDASEQVTSGAWVIEISELGSFTKAEVSKAKAFVSRTVDRFRRSYGRRVKSYPRQCVFAGTVNHTDYLRDETGDRRFLPIGCGKIDLEGLAKDRDQLLAEAVHLYKEGEPWWLHTPGLQKLAADEQSARYKGDPWLSEIERCLTGVMNDLTAPNEVTQTGVFEYLGVEVTQRAQREMNRIAQCLRACGWERRQVRRDSMRKWIYVPMTGDTGD